MGPKYTADEKVCEKQMRIYWTTVYARDPITQFYAMQLVQWSSATYICVHTFNLKLGIYIAIECSNIIIIILYYLFILRYITMVFCNLHCIHMHVQYIYMCTHTIAIYVYVSLLATVHTCISAHHRSLMHLMYKHLSEFLLDSRKHWPKHWKTAIQTFRQPTVVFISEWRQP